MSEMKIRNDLMSENFPSIRLESERENRGNLIIGGFYREWTRHKENSNEAQMKNLSVLTQQIAEATRTLKTTILLGEANLCMYKCEEAIYPHKELGNEIISTLGQSGMKINVLGTTYLADRSKMLSIWVEKCKSYSSNLSTT